MSSRDDGQDGNCLELLESLILHFKIGHYRLATVNSPVCGFVAT